MSDIPLKMWEEHSDIVLSTAYNIMLCLIVLFLCSIGKRVAIFSIEKIKRRVKNFDESLLDFFSAITSYTIYIIGLIIILDIFGVNTTSILAILGAAGLAIALALKDTLNNVASGVMLLLLRPFKINDMIECGSILGTVQKMGLFTCEIKTPDGLFISAPNGALWNHSIKNFTHNKIRRIEVKLGIAYGDSIDKAFTTLQTIVAADPRLLNDPAPKFLVSSLGESAIEIKIRAWVDIEHYWQAYWDLNKAVKEGIQAAGLTIPFPQRDVHLIPSE